MTNGWSSSEGLMPVASSTCWFVGGVDCDSIGCGTCDVELPKPLGASNIREDGGLPTASRRKAATLVS